MQITWKHVKHLNKGLWKNSNGCILRVPIWLSWNTQKPWPKDTYPMLNNRYHEHGKPWSQDLTTCWENVSNLLYWLVSSDILFLMRVRQSLINYNLKQKQNEYFQICHFKLLGPWHANGVKIWVHQDIWQFSRPCLISWFLKSSFFKFPWLTRALQIIFDGSNYKN